MKVTVTEQDIMRGEPRLCGECPVSLALRRAFGCDAWADPQDLVIQGTRDIHFYDTPDEVSRFIRNFDESFENQAQPEPFEFDLSYFFHVEHRS